MNRKRLKTIQGASMALALGLTGCGEGSPPAGVSKPPSKYTSPAEVESVVNQSLERLNALQFVRIDQLVLKLPAHATDCYGLPCPGDTESLALYNAERARQAARLEALTEQAEACNSGHCYNSQARSPAEALTALNALEIVQAGALLEVQPHNTPDCYNLPCAADVAAAAAENTRRLELVLMLTDNAKKRGI